MPISCLVKDYTKMSHVENQSQRDVNKEIVDCMERNAVDDKEWVESEDLDGEMVGEWVDHGKRYTCGPTITISVSQDKCPKCGKIFTY